MSGLHAENHYVLEFLVTPIEKQSAHTLQSTTIATSNNTRLLSFNLLQKTTISKYRGDCKFYYCPWWHQEQAENPICNVRIGWIDCWHLRIFWRRKKGQKQININQAVKHTAQCIGVSVRTVHNVCKKTARRRIHGRRELKQGNGSVGNFNSLHMGNYYDDVSRKNTCDPGYTSAKTKRKTYNKEFRVEVVKICIV